MENNHIPVLRCRPERLDHLCQTTNFSKKEIQRMYRGFKQECPSGVVHEDTFKQIYAQFFPQGNPSLYAHYVFKTFDKNRNGAINFQEFLNRLSLLSRGTTQDKLRWVFNLYDINGDGYITKQEMLNIVYSVYEMLGNCTCPPVNEKTIKDHVEKIFKKLDANRDGIVTIDEFMETCIRDDAISNSLQLFDTIL